MRQSSGLSAVSKTYPNNPNRHAPFHVTFTLGHRTYSGLATVTRGRRRHLERFVRDIDILKDQVRSENKLEKAHVYEKSAWRVVNYSQPTLDEKEDGDGGGSGAGDELAGESTACLALEVFFRVEATTRAADVATWK